MRAALIAFAFALPVPALAFTLSLNGPAVGERPSRFVEVEIGKSVFQEKQVRSSEAPAPQGSTFGLKNVDSALRVQTEKTLSELGAHKSGNRIIVNLPSDVLFDFDKFNIRADAQSVLEKLGQALKAIPQARVTIIGHTDSKGSDDYNQQLSERRALSVMGWLRDADVRVTMATEGKGEAAPVAPNTRPNGADDPDGRQKNRRVEFVIEDAV